MRNSWRVRVLHQGVSRDLSRHALQHRPHVILRTIVGVLLCAGCLLTAPGVAAAAPSLSWSAPVEVDGGHALRGISCPSAELCVAVDNGGRAVVGSRSSSLGIWSWSAFPIDSKALTAVSCASSVLCVAVDGEGRAIVSGDPVGGSGAWSAPLQIDGTTPLTSVSCPSNALCVAVDKEGNVLTSASPATAQPGAWSGPSSIAAALTSVSCASNTLCLAVDGKSDALLSTNPTGGASAWRSRPIDPGAGELMAVSCFLAESCVATDATGDAFASSDAVHGPDATWSSTVFDSVAPNAVSCASTGLCVAVDGAGRAFASDDSTFAPPAWLESSIDTPKSLTGVSCTSEGFCAAVDDSGRLFTAETPAPTASTTAAGEVTHTSAVLTGAVDPNDAALNCRFEYGAATDQELTVPCSGSPSGSTPAPVSVVLANLTPNTTYRYRLLASTAIGTSEGVEATFRTLAPDLVEAHPSISGTPAPGQRLTCKSGVTTSTGLTLAYAWLRDTRTIAGASASTYVVSSADVTHHLQCRVTATTAEGSKSETSPFVTVPAGGLGTVSETTVGAPRAAHDAVDVPVKCSAQAAGSCTLRLRLTAHVRRANVTVGAHTVRLKPNQQATVAVALNATGRRLLARTHRLPVKLSVSGTVIGAISASLKSTTVTLSTAGRASSRKASRGKSAARGKR